MSEAADFLWRIFFSRKEISAESLPPFENLRDLLLQHGLLLFYLDQASESGLLTLHSEEEQYQLQSLRTQQVAFALQLAAVQDCALLALEKSSIPAMVLKGQALSERLYGDIFHRPGGDVDILVEEASFPEAYRALVREGFQAREQNHAFHESLVHPTRPGVLELHRALTDGRYNFNAAEILERSRPYKSGERTCRIADPVDEFVYLCAHHATTGYYQRLIWLLDLAEYLRQFRKELGPGAVAERARQAKTDRAVFASVSSLQHAFPDFAEVRPYCKALASASNRAAWRVSCWVLRDLHPFRSFPGLASISGSKRAGQLRRNHRKMQMLNLLATQRPHWVAKRLLQRSGDAT